MSSSLGLRSEYSLRGGGEGAEGRGCSSFFGSSSTRSGFSVLILSSICRNPQTPAPMSAAVIKKIRSGWPKFPGVEVSRGSFDWLRDFADERAGSGSSGTR